MEYVKMSDGAKYMAVSTSVLVEAFHTHFPDRQRSAGPQAKYKRLKTEYEKFGGLDPDRERRTDRRSRSEAEDDGD